MTGSWVTLLLLLGMTDGYLHVTNNRCRFNSTRPEDIQLISSYVYHKLEYIKFDSKVGRFVGYTEFGVYNAERANNDTAILERWRHEKDRYCVPNIENWNIAILSKSVEPYAAIHTTPSGGSERVLVCSVYGFYPQDITVTWTNNQQQISTGVINSETMPDGDWTYQLHSHLEYAPRSGDQISCVVEHISLKEPMVLDYGSCSACSACFWVRQCLCLDNSEGALSDGDRNKVAIGASGLVLGLVLSLAGFIYYRHKSRGLILVPTH